MTPEQAAERVTEDPWSMTLVEFLQMAEMFNGGITHMQALKNGEPIACVIAVRGQEECAEILEAIASVEHRWELRRALKEGECSES